MFVLKRTYLLWNAKNHNRNRRTSLSPAIVSPAMSHAALGYTMSNFICHAAKFLLHDGCCASQTCRPIEGDAMGQIGFKRSDDIQVEYISVSLWYVQKI